MVVRTYLTNIKNLSEESLGYHASISTLKFYIRSKTVCAKIESIGEINSKIDPIEVGR